MNVAVPILSCLGNWVNVLPTALLSTHTGPGFEQYTFLDLSEEMEKVLEHWRTLDIRFDGIVIGYLGSLGQMHLVEELLTEFMTEDALVVLDPVMGDNGQLYDGFTQEHIAKMKELCQYADVLIPNVTEASYLTGKRYPHASLSHRKIEELLKALVVKENQKIILSGISFEEGKIGAAVWSKADPAIDYPTAKAFPGHFDGTGDLFTSVIAGFLFQCHSVSEATEAAVDYVSKVVKRTIEEEVDPLYGVVFEKDLPDLMNRLSTGTRK